jgi:radial spoke head protein 9
MNLKIQPKPVTELDRLTVFVHDLANQFAVPKGSYKYTPNEETVRNEAFRGLGLEEALQLDNWQFTRKPRDPSIKDMIARGEATYKADCLDSVAKELPRQSWTLRKDMTGSVVTLKSVMYPGLYAFHRCCTSMSGYVYMGEGLTNLNLPFMV